MIGTIQLKLKVKIRDHSQSTQDHLSSNLAGKIHQQPGASLAVDQVILEFA